MNELTQQDKDVEQVLGYLYQHRSGYMRDLEKLNKPQIIEQLQIVGMLHTGNTLKDRTYSITPLGLKHYKIVYKGICKSKQKQR